MKPETKACPARLAPPTARIAVVLAVFGAGACAGAGTPASTPSTPPAAGAAPAGPGARFNERGELEPPVDYRTWVYLTSGFAMSYGPAAQVATSGGVDVMDNVYVSPDAYRGFMATGVWPEATMFVLEIRTAEETGSIVTRGRYQTELVGVEAAVKDSRRWPKGWGYFDFAIDGRGPTGPAAALPTTASCYTCHAAHGAVEQTFTQFYPTLFEVARAKGTVRPDFPGLPPTPAELTARITAGGWPAGSALLEATASKWPGATLLRQSSLTRVARQLARAGRQAESVAVLQEVTRRFPGSARAWDSLSKAYAEQSAPAQAKEAASQGLKAASTDSSLTPQSRTNLEKNLKSRTTR
jgi:hypothetical protein